MSFMSNDDLNLFDPAAIDVETSANPGGIHAFNAFPIELARNANAKINKFIKEAAK